MPNGDTQLSTKDFAAKIRSKYPGAYDDVGDTELTTKILTKYPEYKDMVNMVPPTPQQPATQQQAAAPQQKQSYLSYAMTAPKMGLESGLPSPAQVPSNVGPMQTGAAIGGLVTNPASTIGAVAGGYGLGQGAEYGAQKAGLGPKGQAYAKTGGQLIGGLAGGVSGSKLAEILPNSERAGQMINSIIGKVKDVPVPVFNATSEAGRAMQLGDAGMNPPPVVRKFYARVTNPDKPPLTVAEARDFYTSASKQTAKTWSDLAAPQQRQTSLFTKALGEEVATAIDKEQPGAGQQLQSALDEYHRAMMLSSTVKGAATTAGKSAIRAVPWGVGAAAGGSTVYEALKFLKGKQ